MTRTEAITTMTNHLLTAEQHGHNPQAIATEALREARRWKALYARATRLRKQRASR